LPAFSFFSGDLLPQDSEPVTDLIQNISAGDTRIMNAVYRNGYLWFAHAVAMPAGSYTHTAARWVKADTSGNFVDGGQVEDPTATAVNDGKWYAFPSIAVNRYNDVLLGFSQFSSAQWASAGYAFHDRNDLPGSMRDPYIYKAGEGFYYKIYGGTSNRWGDFSNSQVDPVDDTDLWTIQEYAKPQNGTGVNSGVWSTWWANLALPGLYTSIGTGGNWSVASTWDLNAVPQATDDVVIAAGTTVTVDSNAQCRQLTIEQGGTLVIPTGVNLIVSQSVTNHGTLTMPWHPHHVAECE